MKIVAHTLLKNAPRFGWFAINSVIDYVDEIIVWDTGSTDDTLRIIKSINHPKLKFKEIGPVDENSFTRARQKMLEETQADWILILDSDEIWPRKAIKELVDTIKTEGDKHEFLISRFHNLIGDVYHHQEEAAGQYQIGSHRGHITIRAINMNIPGLHYERPHGQQGLFDGQGTPIQDRVKAHKILNEKYLHATHLRRGMTAKDDKNVLKRAFKYKYELGIPFPADFAYPEVFYAPRPLEVPSPWIKRSLTYSAHAAWQTPLKYIKRRILSLPSGY